MQYPGLMWVYMVTGKGLGSKTQDNLFMVWRHWCRYRGLSEGMKLEGTIVTLARQKFISESYFQELTLYLLSLYFLSKRYISSLKI